MLSNPKSSSLTWLVWGIVAAGVVGIIVWFSLGRDSGIGRAEELYRQGKVAEAAKEYDNILKNFGGSASAWTNYGNALRDIKRPEDAAKAYLQAIKIDPTYHPAYRNLSYLFLDLEEIGGQSGKINEAIRIIEAGFQKAGANPLYLAEDLVMLYTRKGDKAKAAEWQAKRDALLNS